MSHNDYILIVLISVVAIILVGTINFIVHKNKKKIIL